MLLDPTYRTGLVVPSSRWDELSPEIRRLMRDADLVVCDDGIVTKDRLGRVPRRDPAFMALARELPSPAKHG